MTKKKLSHLENQPIQEIIGWTPPVLHQQMLYILFALLTNYDILVEQRTAKGRIDITMETDDTIYVMELKFNKSAEEALAQIEAKHYADAFKMSGKKVVKIGLNFSVKDEVNCLEWKIES